MSLVRCRIQDAGHGIVVVSAPGHCPLRPKIGTSGRRPRPYLGSYHGRRCGSGSISGSPPWSCCLAWGSASHRDGSCTMYCWRRAKDRARWCTVYRTRWRSFFLLLRSPLALRLTALRRRPAGLRAGLARRGPPRAAARSCPSSRRIGVRCWNETAVVRGCQLQALTVSSPIKFVASRPAADSS